MNAVELKEAMYDLSTAANRADYRSVDSAEQAERLRAHLEVLRIEHNRLALIDEALKAVAEFRSSLADLRHQEQNTVSLREKE